MIRSRVNPLITLLLSVAFFTACATVLPSEYGPGDRGIELEGPVLALAGDGDVIIAANPEGIHVRTLERGWKRMEVPGIRDHGRVTALAVRRGEICIGTDGEGLHIFREGTWEVRTARYGGLPDDRVLSVAYDGDQEGFPGSNLWVGTREGLAVRRQGVWSLHLPGPDWMVGLTDRPSGRVEDTFIGSGYSLGEAGEAADFFRPPITAIGVGSDRVVFGNDSSTMAVVERSGVAVVRFLQRVDVISLLVRDSAIWAGTSGGLVWGGRTGVTRGTPWPSHRGRVPWRGKLFGTRDSRPFLYRWHFVGYNVTSVPSLDWSDTSLWVAYGRWDGTPAPILKGEEEDDIEPVTDVRRFINIDDYIARKEAFAYESYGRDDGISGDPLAVLAVQDRGELWIGTTRGLYRMVK